MKNSDIDRLFETAADRELSEEHKEQVKNSVINSLNPEQKKMFEKAISEPEFLNKLLSSPKAKDVLKKLADKE